MLKLHQNLPRPRLCGCPHRRWRQARHHGGASPTHLDEDGVQYTEEAAAVHVQVAVLSGQFNPQGSQIIRVACVESLRVDATPLQEDQESVLCGWKLHNSLLLEGVLRPSLISCGLAHVQEALHCLCLGLRHPTPVERLATLLREALSNKITINGCGRRTPFLRGSVKGQSESFAEVSIFLPDVPPHDVSAIHAHDSGIGGRHRGFTKQSVTILIIERRRLHAFQQGIQLKIQLCQEDPLEGVAPIIFGQQAGSYKGIL
mmetsp:Transcript_119715/g.255452  ORF Transcript_119715/g.255452 Transcript_119715/m.255452 type:complete len:259 (-) Transcript_119715:793-1569(-)